MELALYAPGLGYYSAGARKLGPGGDFVTAPQMSELFSRCLARTCAEVLRRTGGEILELGAGTGAMAAGVLRELAGLGVLPERYAILEVSADLAARQREHLAQLPARAARDGWSGSSACRQRPFDGVILANEVADALPCRRFVCGEGSVRELGVSLSGAGEFQERARADPIRRWRAPARPCSPRSQRRCRMATCRSLSLSVGPWIASLAALPRARGAAAVRLRTAAAPLLSPAARSAARCAAISGSACTMTPT